MKKKMTVLGGLLMAVAITGYSVSGTYAKYISSMDITDEARVAKWSIAMTDKGATSVSDDIDLFKSSYTANIDNEKATYVKAIGGTDKVVAPGTSGFYEFDLTATIETNYTLDFKLLSATDLEADGLTAEDAAKKASVNNVVLTEAEIKANLGLSDSDTLPDAISKDLVNGVYSPLLFRVTVDGTTGDWVTYDELVKTFDTAISGNKYDATGKLTDLLVYGPTTAAKTKLRTVKIEWAWPFDSTVTTVSQQGKKTDAVTTTTVNNAKSNDTLDTMLGNRIAKDGALAEDNTVRLNMRVTATQTTAAVDSFVPAN